MYSEYKYFLVIFHQVFVGTGVFTVWSFFLHQIIVSTKQTPKKSSVCCFWKLHPLISNPPKASSARCWWKLGNSVCWGKFLDCWLWKCKHLFAKCAKYKCRNIKCKTWKCANVEICKIQFGGKFVKFLALDWVLGRCVWECKHPSADAAAQEMDSWLSPQSTNFRRLSQPSLRKFHAV